MTISDITSTLMMENYFRWEQTKLTNCLHRIKDKENPNELLLKFCHKTYDKDDLELVELVNSFDFSTITKPKHGGRGKATGATLKRRKKTYGTWNVGAYDDGINDYIPEYN